MARGRWECFASISATMANCNRDPKKRPMPFLANDFNPMASRNDEPKTMDATDSVKKHAEILAELVKSHVSEQ